MQKDIVLVLPYKIAAYPPLSLPYLKSYLEKNSFETLQIDFSIKIFKKLFSSIFPKKIDLKEANDILDILCAIEVYSLDIDKFNYQSKNKETLIPFFLHPNYKKKYSIALNLKNKFQNLFNSIINELINIDTNIYGFSVIEPSYYPSLYFSKKIKEKKPDAKIILGGPFFFKELGIQILCNHHFIDFIVLNESEITLTKLVSKLVKNKDPNDIKGILCKKNNQIKYNGPQQVIEDLDMLPFPDFDGLPLKMYFNVTNFNIDLPPALPIATSRGCPLNCSFCYERPFWKKYRNRNPKKVVEELIYQSEKYNTDAFYFTESLINGSPKKTIELANYIKKEKIEINWIANASVIEMKKNILQSMNNAGCRGLLYGIESGSNHVLKLMNKKSDVSHAEKVLKITKNSNIWTHCYLMLGYPEETKRDVVATKKFLKKNIKNINSFFVHIAYAPYKPMIDHYNLFKFKNSKETKDLYRKSLGDFWTQTKNKLKLNEIKRYLKEFNVIRDQNHKYDGIPFEIIHGINLS